jgi:hypothetical protein
MDRCETSGLVNVFFSIWLKFYENLFMFKFFCNLFPVYFLDFYKKREQETLKRCYETRNADMFGTSVPVGTTRSMFSFRYIGSEVWSRLSAETKGKRTLEEFRASLRYICFNQYSRDGLID